MLRRLASVAAVLIDWEYDVSGVQLRGRIVESGR